jgi:hypothetical protein
MKKETVRTLMIVAGVLFLLCVLGLGTLVWFFTRSFEVSKADEASAVQRFDEIRQRFKGVTPILEIRDDEPVVTRRPAAGAGRTQLTTLRIVHWSPRDEDYSRIDVPFWLLRMKSGPIEIASDNSRWSDHDLGVTVEDLERYGPTLILDHEQDNGDRVLVWTE